MELDSIERQIYVDASPEIVYEVITSAEHIREWWSDDASLDAQPGGVGWVAFGEQESARSVAPMTVLEAIPPRFFSFRWAYDASDLPDPSNSFLVTFDLEPSGRGTTLRLIETGFLDQGVDEATVVAAYADHARGWDRFVPRLAEYAAGLSAPS